MKNSTMKDVAQLASVSVATVSHVLNKSRVVSEETQTRVYSAMEELKYQPNALAQSLRKKTTSTIGIIVADLDNEHFTAMVRILEEKAYEYGYNAILCNTNEDGEKEKFYFDLLLQKQTDGIIVAPTNKNHSTIQRIQKIGPPMVFIDRYVEGIKGIPYFGCDNTDASFRAVRHLIEGGDRRIDMLFSLPEITPIKERIAGYNKAMHQSGLSPHLVDMPYDDDLTQCVKSLHDRYAGRDFPDAFFVASNKLYLHLVAFLAQEGIACPSDVRTIGYGSQPWADYFSPRLSLISVDNKQIGEMAISRLISMIQSEHGDQENTVQPDISPVVVPARITLRDSSRKL